jgi:chorismate mutase
MTTIGVIGLGDMGKLDAVELAKEHKVYGCDLPGRRDELAKPIERDPSRKELEPVDIDIGDKILTFYHEILPVICQKDYNKNERGETVLQDSLNLRKLYERICGVGPYVAQSKIQDDLSLLEITNEAELRKALVYPQRERDVMAKGLRLARKYKLPNPRIAKDIFRRIIDLTLDVEVAYIQHVQKQKFQERKKQEPKYDLPIMAIGKTKDMSPVGFGQVVRVERNGSRGGDVFSINLIL